jgi:phosphohistidine phosphatase
MTKNIIFIRHGHADEGEYPDDRKRPLSEKGKVQIHNMGKKLKDLGFSPDYIFASPYLRAKQSADIIGELFGTKIEVPAALAYDLFDEDFLLNRLNSLLEGKTFVLLGHDPTLTDFANKLASTNCLPAGLSKGTAAIIEFQGDIIYGKGHFNGHYRPED